MSIAVECVFVRPVCMRVRRRLGRAPGSEERPMPSRTRPSIHRHRPRLSWSLVANASHSSAPDPVLGSRTHASSRRGRSIGLAKASHSGASRSAGAFQPSSTSRPDSVAACSGRSAAHRRCPREGRGRRGRRLAKRGGGATARRGRRLAALGRLLRRLSVGVGRRGGRGGGAALGAGQKRAGLTGHGLGRLRLGLGLRPLGRRSRAPQTPLPQSALQARDRRRTLILTSGTSAAPEAGIELEEVGHVCSGEGGGPSKHLVAEALQPGSALDERRPRWHEEVLGRQGSGGHNRLERAVECLKVGEAMRRQRPGGIVQRAGHAHRVSHRI